MSHRNRVLAVGLLMVTSLAPAADADTAERNPFQPVSVASCGSDRGRLASWQLQGIVSGADYHSSWGRWPGGRGQKLVVGQQLLPDWQVTEISARQVSLEHISPDKTCAEFSASVVLSMR